VKAARYYTRVGGRSKALSLFLENGYFDKPSLLQNGGASN